MERKIDLSFNSNPKETAYFMGFFWADGCINSKKYLVTEIVEDDGKYLMEIFNKVAEFKVSYRNRKNRKPQMLFFLKDETACEKLIELGKYPGTVESHSKVIDFVPEAYRIYFLRGLIDGDGCFYSGPANHKWNNNTVHFTIGSRYEQDWSGLITYCSSIGFNLTPIKRTHKNGQQKSSIVRSSNFHDIETFVSKLYEINDNIWLERKYSKIQNAILEHKKHIQESNDRRKKYEITLENGEVKITNNLKEFCLKNGMCYDCVNRAANKNGKYKNFIIRKIEQVI